MDHHRVQVPALFKKHQLRLLGIDPAESIVERNPSTELKQQPQLLEEVDVRGQPEFIHHDCACDAHSSVSSFCCGSQGYLRKKLAKAENKALVYGPMKSSWAAAMLKVDVYRQVRSTLLDCLVGMVVSKFLWGTLICVH